jgi:putative transposase
MERSRLSEEQTANAPRHPKTGMGLADLCRQIGMSDTTLCVWRKKHAHRGGVNELHRLRQLGTGTAP